MPPIYKDPTQSVEARVDDLLSRMTFEEKIGQMCLLDGRIEPEKWITQKHIGSFLHIIGPRTNELQKVAEQTRLGIPLIFGIDAIHGHAFWPKATVFPTQLGLSCAWNPDLLTEVGRITAKEAAATGMHWTFSPVLCLARDLRWGRIDETFGEDPYLIGELGKAIIKGYQGDNLADPHRILACAKHYVGYSASQGGRDAAEAELSRRNLRSLYLKPFHEAAKASCATFMTGYQSIDGQPCTVNRWLMTDVLKEEWGFAGFTVTDWDNVGRLHREQMVSPTIQDAGRRAVEAGNDMMMTTPAFFDAAVSLVKDSLLDEAVIDEACRRVLHQKFTLGLFDNRRYTDLDSGAAIIGCADHHAAALEAAYQSLVLLENKNNLLPLDVSKLKRIAVIGPNADDRVAQLGDWSFLGAMEAVMNGKLVGEDYHADTVTVLQGIKARVGQNCQIDYLQGCDVIDPAVENIAAAVELARQADVAIMVVGDTLSQNGEVRDRANLDLSGAQQQLMEAVHATGTPMVVVLISGKPLTIPWIAQNAGVVVEAWNPGSQGGVAVAGVLFGDRNPSGKLTISFAHHVGQQPVYYNLVPGWHAQKYIDMPVEPLYPFGYGLSYTTYAYRNLVLHSKTLAAGETLKVSVEVQNTGNRAGVEIVQLYLNDVYTSVTTPQKELKAFARVELAPGETKTMLLEVPFEQLALVNAKLETIVEPGEFEVMVGPSSRHEDLLKDTFVVA
ncbi:MAG: glycoside hydrolase family 3 C-terminal domain-containing protein [Anaerolineae bacterium]|nr:glycoside hydrolase family 3 C-terminal domain-containing protein [Anaerolineae bacterium]